MSQTAMHYPAASTRLPVGGEGKRLALVDGMRGLAAIGVVFFHLFGGTLREPLARVIPYPIAMVFENGHLGVQVFFVISGFVIAYSLRNSRVTAGLAGRFVLRRHIRLDFVYWAAIALALVDLSASRLSHPGQPSSFPSAAMLVAHLVYVQGLCDFGYLTPVFWTLCIEVQFYVVFLLVVSAAQVLAARWRGKLAPLAYAMAIVPLTLTSLVLLAVSPMDGTEWPPRPWFVSHWYLFSLGALAWWALDQKVRPSWFYGFVVLVAGAGLVHTQIEPLIGVTVALLFHLAGQTDWLQTGLNNCVLQYLGRISYSLYLVHHVVGYRFLNGGHRLTGDSSIWAMVWFILALTASVVAAHVLYVIVERPSLRLAAAVRYRQTRSRVATDSPATVAMTSASSA